MLLQDPAPATKPPYFVASKSYKITLQNQSVIQCSKLQNTRLQAAYMSGAHTRASIEFKKEISEGKDVWDVLIPYALFLHFLTRPVMKSRITKKSSPNPNFFFNYKPNPDIIPMGAINQWTYHINFLKSSCMKISR